MVSKINVLMIRWFKFSVCYIYFFLVFHYFLGLWLSIINMQLLVLYTVPNLHYILSPEHKSAYNCIRRPNYVEEKIGRPGQVHLSWTLPQQGVWLPKELHALQQRLQVRSHSVWESREQGMPIMYFDCLFSFHCCLSTIILDMALFCLPLCAC